MKLVCFDIDGTLLSTDGAGRRAIHRALVEVLGTAGPIDSLRFDGRTDGEIVRKLADAAEIAHDETMVEQVLTRYVDELKAELAKPQHVTTVYPGVPKLLEELHRHEDAVLALLTGNVAGGAELKLRSAGLPFEWFVLGAYGSDHHVRSELPAVALRRANESLPHPLAGHDVVIIGDTPADVQCGRGVGARAIGVATGSYTVAQLVDAGAYKAFTDLADTRRVVDAIFA